MRTIHLCVNESQQGRRIDSYLASVLDDVSRTPRPACATRAASCSAARLCKSAPWSAPVMR